MFRYHGSSITFRPNIPGFSYTLNPNIHEWWDVRPNLLEFSSYKSSKMQDSTPLNSTMCWVQCIWVLLGVKRNITGFSKMLNSKTYESGNVLDSNIFGFNYALSLITFGSSTVLNSYFLEFSYTLSSSIFGPNKTPRPSYLEFSYVLNSSAYGSG
jgi:hypothetical protein